MTSLELFYPTVQNYWSLHIEGNAQFQLSQKLKRLVGLKLISKDIIGREKINLDKARNDLFTCQQDRDVNPRDVNLMLKEKEKLKIFVEAARIEEDIDRQKSRLQWLEGGDKNSKYFHNSIKHRRNNKRIISLTRPDGSITSDENEAKIEGTRFYQGLLGSFTTNRYPGIQELKYLFQNLYNLPRFKIWKPFLMTTILKMPSIASTTTRLLDLMGTMPISSKRPGILLVPLS